MSCSLSSGDEDEDDDDQDDDDLDHADPDENGVEEEQGEEAATGDHTQVNVPRTKLGKGKMPRRPATKVTEDDLRPMASYVIETASTWEMFHNTSPNWVKFAAKVRRIGFGRCA